MTKRRMTVTAVIVVAVVVALLVAVQVSSAHNEEVQLRHAVAAKQRDNESEYDALWKKIAQAAQVTKAQREALLEVLREHAKARGGGGEDRSIIRWLHESVPDVDPATFTNLQNIITSSRDRFAMRQRELLDLKRHHDVLLGAFPSGVILSWFGRDPLEVTVITSGRTDEVFGSGKDDDIALPLGEK